MLSCDSSNSFQLPPVQWFNEAGEMVSSGAVLMLTDILKSQAGTYTCQTNPPPPNSENSTSSSATVVVQCKSQLYFEGHL